MEHDTLRERILAEIERRGLTVAETARLAGVKYDVIRDMKRKKALTTSSEKAVQIANALGISIPDVKPTDLSEKELEALALFRSFEGEQERDFAIDVLRRLRGASVSHSSDSLIGPLAKASGTR